MLPCLSSPITRATAPIVGVVVALGWVVLGATPAEQTDRTAPFITAPERYVTDIAITEEVLAVVQKSIRSTFLDGVRDFDWERASRGLSPDFLGRFPAPDDGLAIDDPSLVNRRYVAADLGIDRRDQFPV